MRRIAIFLPDEVIGLLDAEARRLQISISEIIRRLIVERFTEKSEDHREIPWAGLFSDPEMVPGERLDEQLSATWADDIQGDRG